MEDQTRKFTAILEPVKEGGFVVKCVEVPVATEGETRGEAIEYMKDAVEGYPEVRAEILFKNRETILGRSPP